MTPREAQLKRTTIDQLRKLIPEWQAQGRHAKVKQAEARIEQLEQELKQ